MIHILRRDLYTPVHKDSSEDMSQRHSWDVLRQLREQQVYRHVYMPDANIGEDCRNRSNCRRIINWMFTTNKTCSVTSLDARFLDIPSSVRNTSGEEDTPVAIDQFHHHLFPTDILAVPISTVTFL